MIGNYDTPTWAHSKLYYFYTKHVCVCFEQQQRKRLYNIWVKTIKYMINTVYKCFVSRGGCDCEVADVSICDSFLIKGAQRSVFLKP